MARATDNYQMSIALDAIFAGIKPKLTELLGYDENSDTLSDKSSPVETPTKTQSIESFKNIKEGFKSIEQRARELTNFESFKNIKLDEGLKSNEQRARELTKATTYTELKAVITTQDTQFAKLKQIFAISSDVLNHTLPELFEIIDTVSVKNIIYDKTDLVNTLLNDVLFSELTKIDNNLKKLYNKVGHNPCDMYKSIRIEYLNSHKYRVTYPDFLADAFETIINKLRKNDDFNNILTIKAMTPEEEHQERITLQTTSTTLMMIATAAATAAAMEKATAEDKAKLIKESDAIADLKAKIKEAMNRTDAESKYTDPTKDIDEIEEFINDKVSIRIDSAEADMKGLASKWAEIFSKLFADTGAVAAAHTAAVAAVAADSGDHADADADADAGLADLLRSLNPHTDLHADPVDADADSVDADADSVDADADDATVAAHAVPSVAQPPANPCGHREQARAQSKPDQTRRTKIYNRDGSIYTCGIDPFSLSCWSRFSGGANGDLKEFNLYEEYKNDHVPYFQEFEKDNVDTYTDNDNDNLSKVVENVMSVMFNNILKNEDVSKLKESEVFNKFRIHWGSIINDRRSEVVARGTVLLKQIGLLIEVNNAGYDTANQEDNDNISIEKIREIVINSEHNWFMLVLKEADEARAAMMAYILDRFILHESMISIIESFVIHVFKLVQSNKRSL